MAWINFNRIFPLGFMEYSLKMERRHDFTEYDMDGIPTQ